MNVLLGIPLAGPNGTYALDRFSAVRVEFRSGPIGPGIQGGPNELIWLVGKPGTRAIVLARTDDRAGRALGWEIRRAARAARGNAYVSGRGFPSFSEYALSSCARKRAMARSSSRFRTRSTW